MKRIFVLNKCYDCEGEKLAGTFTTPYQAIRYVQDETSAGRGNRDGWALYLCKVNSAEYDLLWAWEHRYAPDPSAEMKLLTGKTIKRRKADV